MKSYSITTPRSIMEAKLKELVWKLDREVWAKVPTEIPIEEAWTTSKAREESAKLIVEYFGIFPDEILPDSKLQVLTEQLRLTNSDEKVAAYLRWIITSDTAKEYWFEQFYKGSDEKRF